MTTTAREFLGFSIAVICDFMPRSLSGEAPLLQLGLPTPTTPKTSGIPGLVPRKDRKLTLPFTSLWRTGCSTAGIYYVMRLFPL